MTDIFPNHAPASGGRFVPVCSPGVGLVRGRCRAAFSLIEVVLALGVLAVSFLVIFSLIPVGQGMMASSTDATVGMQIVQRVTTLARQAKYSELVPRDGQPCKLNRYPGTDSRGEKSDFFFNDEGVEVEDAVSVTDPRVVYSAAVVLLAQTTVPTGNPTAGAQIANPNIATLNIIIKKNTSVPPVRVVNVLIADNGL
jgi:uncharacterized protein (TIGR02598 family)